VWKRKDSHYVSGRSPYWVMLKNPARAAVRRDGEPHRQPGVGQDRRAPEDHTL
jgi:hypothetical protein